MSGTHVNRHIVALSGGADSTAMALALAEREPRDYAYVCTPTGDELPEMFMHWRRLGDLLGKPLEVLTTGRSLAGLIREWNALPNWRMRWCTRVLKIEPFQAYVASHSPCVVYVGLRADETDREGVEYQGEVTRRFPLVEWGWGRTEVIWYLARRNVVIPERTDCAGCFFQTLGEWHSLWQNHPEKYAEWEAKEAATGHTMRSPSRDTHPAALAELRVEFEEGYRPKRTRMKDRPAMCGTCAR
jgi:3'-phosphoadenosine 5'-phosphosulfate sulfotransferase (PAPS reductase)/FAD synthetase